MQVHKTSTQTTKRAAKTVENSMASERKRKSCHSDHRPEALEDRAHQELSGPLRERGQSWIGRPIFGQHL